MTRLVTLLVGINAAAGIAAFVLANNLYRRGKKRAQDLLRIEQEEEGPTETRKEDMP